MTAMQSLRAGALFLTLAFFAGCATCPSNQKAGIPVILCQPEDVTITATGSTNFSVSVDQPHAAFRWIHSYRDGDGALQQVQVGENYNGSQSQITVSGSQPNVGGLYYCLIESAFGAETRTRDASLVVYNGALINEKKLRTDLSAPHALSLTNLVNPQLSTGVLRSSPGGQLTTCGANFSYQSTCRFIYISGTTTKIHSPVGATSCTLHMRRTSTPATDIANTSWNCTWTTLKEPPGTWYCTMPSGTFNRTFTVPVLDQDTDFSFNAYFSANDSGATYELTVNWF